MPYCLKRVEAVRDYRLNSTSPGTKKLADKPTHFHVETILTKDFLILPLTSSQNRRYVPIGFMDKNTLASNLVIVVPNASLYHFGVLTSNVFMGMDAQCLWKIEKRLQNYKNNVYNNFPWPQYNTEQQEKIIQTAKMILEARNEYPNIPYSELYGEKMYLFPNLLKAHQENDKAVMEAYGWNWRE